MKKNKQEAIKQIHFPSTKEELEKARFTLIFEEFFLLQLKLFLIREKTSSDLKTVSLKIKEDGLVNTFIKKTKTIPTQKSEEFPRFFR